MSLGRRVRRWLDRGVGLAMSEESYQVGWMMWKKNHAEHCADCGHQEYHHYSVVPGCHYLGSCDCLAFKNPV